MIHVQPAQYPRDAKVVRELFQEYADSLGIDLAFQEFEKELDALPGKYEAPAGRLLLAWRDEEAVGCVALRPLDATACEMKRLYVRPVARGEQLGRRLAERLCAEAKIAGYARIYLDTLSSMTAAQSLYASLHFVPTSPYVFNPIPGARFLVKDLSEVKNS